jgi:hypothetical protein
MPPKQKQLRFNDIRELRTALIDIIDYIKSLDSKNISQDTRAELLRIHEDYYKLVDIIDKKLQVPRISPEGRANIEKEEH